MLFLNLCILLLSTYLIFHESESAQTNPYWNNFRLPYTIKPFHYDLTLQILKNEVEHTKQFHGNVSIGFFVLENTDKIILHQDNLKVLSKSLKCSKDPGYSIDASFLFDVEYYDHVKQLYIIVLRSGMLIHAGTECVLNMKYVGSVRGSESEFGLIRSMYVDRDQHENTVFFTKLAPEGARKLLPCWDEPDRKAEFSLSVVQWSGGMVVLSNMPIQCKQRLSRAPLGWFYERRSIQNVKVIGRVDFPRENKIVGHVLMQPDESYTFGEFKVIGSLDFRGIVKSSESHPFLVIAGNITATMNETCGRVFLSGDFQVQNKTDRKVSGEIQMNGVLNDIQLQSSDYSTEVYIEIPLNTTQSLNFTGYIISSERQFLINISGLIQVIYDQTPNNQIEVENDEIELELIQFQRTPVPMSPYLVAIVLLTNYESISMFRDGVNINIWSPKGQSRASTIPLQSAFSFSRYLTQELGIESPLFKTDHVEIPNFPSGAMENWGLITYSEHNLLIPPHLGQQGRQHRLTTIAHELSHVPFGNLVTLSGWHELWLNEAFASLYGSMAYYNKSNLPANIQAELQTFENRQILEIDRLSSATPVIFQQTDSIKFIRDSDTLTYEKGKFMLAWLQSLITPQSFNSVVRKYLKLYAKKNPTTKQFFDIIEQFSPKHLPNMSEFFYPWLFSSNFPVVNVDFNFNTSEIILSQISINKELNQSSKWPIHIIYQFSARQNPKEIIFNESMSTLNHSEAFQYLILNINGKSYVRVNYSDRLWILILDHWINQPYDFDSTAKSVLLDDYFYFVNNFDKDLSMFKYTLETFTENRDLSSWLVFQNSIFQQMSDMKRFGGLFDKWRTFVINISRNALNIAMHLPFNENRLDYEMFQSTIIGINCEIKNPIAQEWINKQFLEWIKFPYKFKLPNHLVEIILHYGTKLKAAGRWTAMWNMFHSNHSVLPITRTQLMIGMVGAGNSSQLKMVLDLFFEPFQYRTANIKFQEFTELSTWLLKAVDTSTFFQTWLLDNSLNVKKHIFSDWVPSSEIEGFCMKLLRSADNESDFIDAFIKQYGVDYTMIRNHRKKTFQWQHLVGEKLLAVL